MVVSFLGEDQYLNIGKEKKKKKKDCCEEVLSHDNTRMVRNKIF